MGHFDHQSQIVGQEAPEELLELITGISPAQAIRHDAKVSPAARYPDHLYRVGPRFVQLELAKLIRPDTFDQLIRQRAAIYLAYGLVPVHQYLIPMCQRDAPAHIPETHRVIIDDGADRFDPGIRFRVIRLWEIDPERVFALRHPSLLPWVLVMNSTPAQMREAIRRIQQDPRSEELLQRASTLAPLRLEPTEFNDIIKEGYKAVTYRELIQDTWLYDEIHKEAHQAGLEAGRQAGLEAGRQAGLEAGRQAGLEAGRQEGLEAGRLADARQSIRRLAAKKIPGLGPLPGLDQVLSLAELHDCLDRVGTALTAAEAELAIAPYRSR